jgi:hypothetical protein
MMLLLKGFSPGVGRWRATADHVGWVDNAHIFARRAFLDKCQKVQPASPAALLDLAGLLRLGLLLDHQRDLAKERAKLGLAGSDAAGASGGVVEAVGEGQGLHVRVSGGGGGAVFVAGASVSNSNIF